MPDFLSPEILAYIHRKYPHDPVCPARSPWHKGNCSFCKMIKVGREAERKDMENRHAHT